MVCMDFIVHALLQPKDQTENHSPEIQQHAALISNSLGGKAIPRWNPTPMSSSVDDSDEPH